MNKTPFRKYFVLALPILLVLTVWLYKPFGGSLPPNAIQNITIRRCADNPLITPGSSPSIGENINGPSVIRVPEWVNHPLGRYYMYFAHHRGKYIRMAYADHLSGPWTVYETGVLHLEQAPLFKNHIASPDVFIDRQNKLIQMYFHGPLQGKKKGQKTSMASSTDGLLFHPDNKILGRSYFRVFHWDGHVFAVSGGGLLYRREDEDGHWLKRERRLNPPVTVDDGYGRRTDVEIRHSAVIVEDGRLFLFHSRKRDAPERILVSTVTLTGDWNQWTASEPIDVIRPREIYEGTQYPIRPSKGGPATHVHQVRDPYVFQEDGKYYLFYSVAGEMGIAMAEIAFTLKTDGGHHSN